jgi:hypothetical protein
MNRIMIAVPVVLLFCFTGPMVAQDIPQKLPTHEFIVQFPGLRKDKIFERVVRWLENNLRSPKPVIDKEDEESGTIVGNGMTEMRAGGDSVDVRLTFTIATDVRDGKARFRFLDLEITSGPDAAWETMPADTLWHRPAQKKFGAVVERLTEYVKSRKE